MFERVIIELFPALKFYKQIFICSSLRKIIVGASKPKFLRFHVTEITSFIMTYDLKAFI